MRSVGDKTLQTFNYCLVLHGVLRNRINVTSLGHHCFVYFLVWCASAWGVPQLSHVSMFTHIRLHAWVCVQTPPCEPSIIVSERRQFWVLVPLNVFQENSHVKHFGFKVLPTLYFLESWNKLINHRASGNLQIWEKPRGVGQYYKIIFL